MKYVSVCHNNLCNDNEVIDIMGPDRPPVIDQLQDATSSLLSSNTSSLLSSNVLSPLSSNNSSRSLTSVRLKTNSDNNSLFLSSSQSTKMARATQVTLELPIFFFFCDWAMGSMSEGIYNTPHQERCVARGLGGSISEMLPWAHKGCTVRVHRLCKIDWLRQHDLEIVYNDPFFCRQHNECYQNYV